MRDRLPSRRSSDTVTMRHGGHVYTVTAGYYADGRIGEVFIDPARQGSDLGIAVRDAAVAASLALQFGCPPDVLAAALLATEDGSPAGVLGAAMGAVAHA